jgi:methionine synthase I (cobalamin-dependent)
VPSVLVLSLSLSLQFIRPPSSAHTAFFFFLPLRAGAVEIRPFLQQISNLAECFVSCYPNAGLPNGMGGYDETPEMTAAFLRHAATHY